MIVKKAMEKVFDKKRKPTMFLSNFFQTRMLKGKKVELQSRTVKSIYSVDVKLGTGGRLMDFSSFDKTEYTVPEYNDYAVITEDEMFNQNFGETEYTEQVTNIVDKITEKQEIISDAQRRAEEKQATDALLVGEITLADGSKITFNKLATHTIDLANKEWNVAAGDPVTAIANACQLCIDDGKISGQVFNLILETSGLAALLANAKFIANSNAIAGIKRSDINMPVEKTPGAVFHGQFAVGNFIINLWSYNQKIEIPVGYNLANEGTEVGLIPVGYGILLPENPNFVKYYGAVNNTNAPLTAPGAKLSLQQVEQLPYAYDVVKHGSSVTEAGVKSRPLHVPADVNAFATFKNIYKAPTT